MNRWPDRLKNTVRRNWEGPHQVMLRQRMRDALMRLLGVQSPSRAFVEWGAQAVHEGWAAGPLADTGGYRSLSTGWCQTCVSQGVREC